MAEPWKRDNNKRIREALQQGTKLYALVRTLDGWVHADDFWRINVYTEQEVKARGPSDVHWKWVEVDPSDPTYGFNADEHGSFWAGPIPYGRK